MGFLPAVLFATLAFNALNLGFDEMGATRPRYLSLFIFWFLAGPVSLYCIAERIFLTD